MKNKSIIIPILISLLLIGCKKGEIKDSSSEQLSDESTIESVSKSGITPKGVYGIHTELQHTYLSNSKETINDYADGSQELSRPLPLQFRWEGEIGEYTVTLSENEDYSNPFVYTVNECSVSFTNLKIDTTYYYKVIKGEQLIKEDAFITSDEIIRNLYISGITNARDLGGYKIDDGVIKQGLIFRTAKLNANLTEAPSRLISDKGMNTMLNDLKVKSEIDLRLVSNNEVGGLTEGVGVLGESVKYYQCPMNMSESLDNELNTEGVKRVFSILGDRSNYPTFFHCSIGTDRTGYIAWLINAYLGVNEEKLWRDYLFSNFGLIDGSRTIDRIKDKYVKTLYEYRGDTLSEKTKNYLLDKGVTQAQLDVLREMMIEERPSE